MKTFTCLTCRGLGKVDWIAYMRNDKQYFKERKKLIESINFYGFVYTYKQEQAKKLVDQLCYEIDCPDCEGSGHLVELETKEDLFNYVRNKIMEKLNASKYNDEQLQ